MIWKYDSSVEELNSRFKHDLGSLLEIEFTEIGEDFLTARMPVTERVHQPAGILHGGASVVLAETVGSVASGMLIDREKQMAVGLEINANHLRPVKKGFVTATCRPVHIGGKTHVWDIRLFDDRGKMSCISRLTVAVVPKIQ